jgi:uncharacterized protein (DUF1800 family)
MDDMPDPTAILATRFGFGLPDATAQSGGIAGMLGALSGEDAGAALWPGPRLRGVLQVTESYKMALRNYRLESTPEARHAKDEWTARFNADAGAFLRRTLARAIDSPDGFRERLVWFWQDHFTTTPRRVEYTLISASRTDHAIRPHVAGRFADLLRAAILHPSMLLYLDQVYSVGPDSDVARIKSIGLNENLARELMELHTLGVSGGYTQGDVRQMAELLTGLALTGRGRTAFLQRRAEPGAEQVLGRSYGGEGIGPIHAVLDDLARHPDTARHLSRKLAVHFLSDTPDEAVIDRMAAAYLANDTALLPVYAEMLGDPAALSTTFGKVRPPMEIIAAGMRAIGMRGSDVMALEPRLLRRHVRVPLIAMGQGWEDAKGPDGWPEDAETWLTAQRVAARISWAMQAPTALWAARGGEQRLPDPREVLVRALGPIASPALQQAVARAETARDAVGIVIASPEFNRR